MGFLYKVVCILGLGPTYTRTSRNGISVVDDWKVNFIWRCEEFMKFCSVRSSSGVPTKIRKMSSMKRFQISKAHMKASMIGSSIRPMKRLL